MDFLHYLGEVDKERQVAILERVDFLFDDLNFGKDVIGKCPHLFHGCYFHDLSLPDFLVDERVYDILTVLDDL